MVDRPCECSGCRACEFPGSRGCPWEQKSKEWKWYAEGQRRCKWCREVADEDGKLKDPPPPPPRTRPKSGTLDVMESGSSGPDEGAGPGIGEVLQALKDMKHQVASLQEQVRTMQAESHMMCERLQQVHRMLHAWQQDDW